MTSLLGFPETVDERAARVVAGGVVALGTTSLVTGQPWLLAPVAGGFAARVLTGPKVSPLALLATRVVVPRLPGPARPVPGSPKRLAQAMGFSLSLSSLVLALKGRRRASRALLGMLIGAASLEAFAGICLACKMFPYLVRLGLANDADCPDCAHPWDRLHHRSHAPVATGEGHEQAAGDPASAGRGDGRGAEVRAAEQALG
jgi:hypothetical protein